MKKKSNSDNTEGIEDATGAYLGRTLTPLDVEGVLAIFNFFLHYFKFRA